MNEHKITLKKITEDNYDHVIKLSDTLTPYQKECVAPNIYSLAEAYVFYDAAWPRAIYLDDTPIGFVMLSLKSDDDDDIPSYYLWRFMVAQAYQAKGYGKQVLDMIIDKCREDHITILYTSCETKGKQPYKFYIDYGFIDTGIVDEGEQVLKYTL